MREWLRRHGLVSFRRLRRLGRRRRRELRAWLERTDTIVHLSALVFVPLLIAVVTRLSRSFTGLSFLLFPPLASGTYTLFANPEGEYASPLRFVGGLTLGAGCGWLALVVSRALQLDPGAGAFAVSPLAAAVSVLLAGLVTWLAGVEEPSAYSTALLALLIPAGQEAAYLVSVALGSAIVAGVFLLWRERFYERRASLLYHSTTADDHVLVPMRGEHPRATAMLGARLAGAHDAGKVVLLDIVSDSEQARAERKRLADGGASVAASVEAGGDGSADQGVDDLDASVAALRKRADAIRTRVGVPCEVAVAVEGGSLADTIVAAAERTGCDLVAVGYERERGHLAHYIRDLFRRDLDVLVHRSVDGRTRWRRVLVPVRRASDVAHSMIDFALRLARGSGQVSVCTCIGEGGNRRQAEAMLSNLVDPLTGPIETRVARMGIHEFLNRTADSYDLVVIGASRDRSRPSRIVTPPTFEKIRDLPSDVVVVDR